jgi:hypothetical protein
LLTANKKQRDQQNFKALFHIIIIYLLSLPIMN